MHAQGQYFPQSGYMGMVAVQPMGQPVTAIGKGAMAATAHGGDPSGGQGPGNGELSEMRQYQAQVHRWCELQMHTMRDYCMKLKRSDIYVDYYNRGNT